MTHIIIKLGRLYPITDALENNMGSSTRYGMTFKEDFQL